MYQNRNTNIKKRKSNGRVNTEEETTGKPDQKKRNPKIKTLAGKKKTISQRGQLSPQMSAPQQRGGSIDLRHFN